MGETNVRGIAYDFAVQTVKICKEIAKREHEYAMTDQLIRSATSIGANLHEAEFAASRADFLNKQMIALKEAGETRYWIRMLHDTEYLEETEYKTLLPEINSIVNILTASTKKLKETMRK